MPKFAVHQYHVVRRKFLIEAESAQAAAQLADTRWPHLEVVEEADAEEVLDEVLVDPLLPSGEADLDRSIWLQLHRDGVYRPRKDDERAKSPDEAATNPHALRRLTTTAIFLYEGLRAAAGDHFEQLLDRWGQGHYELGYELAIVAERVRAVGLKVNATVDDHGGRVPGIFDYEVSEQLGAQLAKLLLQHRGNNAEPLCPANVEPLLYQQLQQYYLPAIAQQPKLGQLLEAELQALLPFLSQAVAA
ncbi:hypothetical protein CEK28_03845 [Xenophilus sp. AP218F]|nr:hypothetical protein CEK28_03845 [Xenophilus sp. AP218F]